MNEMRLGFTTCPHVRGSGCPTPDRCNELGDCSQNRRNVLYWLIPPDCPSGCGCEWLDDPDRADCACNGPCCEPGWEVLPDGNPRLDRGDACPYYLRLLGVPGFEGGTCSMGCQDEPACVTGDWRSDQERAALRDVLARQVAEIAALTGGEQA